MLFYDCKKASIYSLNNVFLCDAAVSDIKKDSVTLTINGSSADILSSEVYVVFYDSTKGLVKNFCELSMYKEDMVSPGVFHSRVHCDIGREISVEQRRNDVKVPVNIPVSLSHAGGNTAAVLRNLSAGGTFFVCDYAFPPGSEVEFSFAPQQGAAPITVSARVLRVQEGDALAGILGGTADITEGMMGYGCQFMELPSRTEAAIRNHVFRLDLDRRRKAPPEY